MSRTEAFLAFFQGLEALRSDPTLTIVDVGAQDLQGESHVYSALTAIWPHRVVGFEPTYAQEVVEATAAGVRRVVPYALGDGAERALHVTKYSALSSFYKPNRILRDEFHGPKHFHEIVETVPMQTRALDALDLEQADFIKLDTQGAEPLILTGGERYVRQTPLVYCETFFVPFYENMPLFDEHLSRFRTLGFELLDLYPQNHRRAAVEVPDAYPALGSHAGAGRLVGADALYGQRYLTAAEPSAAPPLKALKAALLLHFLFEKYDVVARILELHAGARPARDYVGMIKIF
jgi:FkbM family methyltransferase